MSLEGDIVEPLSRRSFFKLCLSGLLGLGLTPRSQRRDTYTPLPGPIGRIASDEKVIFIYEKPDYESEVVRETHFDELINLYYDRKIFDKDDHAYIWHRVWGGYLPGRYVQPTYYRLNRPLQTIPECGQLAEVTVPFTQTYQYDKWDGWVKFFRLYYGTTHWITGLKKGPDGKTWYKITSELSDTLYYYVPREHLRPISDSEYFPLAIEVPSHEKKVEILLSEQKMTAYEYGKPVKKFVISSGLGYKEVPKGTATPTGRHNVDSKFPTKHMGSVVSTGAPGGYSLPGVPWTTFFIWETGVAFHGTYWHNNFGHQMSHGCINMKNEDAKWLFRWINPPYDPPYRDHCDWGIDRIQGTLIEVKE